MSSDSKLTQSFHIDLSLFKTGQAVLIGYQTDAFVVLVPSLRRSVVAIEYAKIVDGRDKNPYFPTEMFENADVVFALSSTGDVHVVKDPTRVVPCDGHVAVTPKKGTLWDHYWAGALPTVDMDFHLDFAIMRTIVRAVLLKGPTMLSVGRALGVTRHRLRRRLVKYGMPRLEVWGMQSADWQRKVAEFARDSRESDRFDGRSDLREMTRFASDDVRSTTSFPGGN